MSLVLFNFPFCAPNITDLNNDALRKITLEDILEHPQPTICIWYQFSQLQSVQGKPALIIDYTVWLLDEMLIHCCVRFESSLQKEFVNLTKLVPGFNRWTGWWWKRNKSGGFHTSSLHLLFLSLCSSHLSSYISSHLSVVFPPDNILPSVFYSALLSPRLVTVQIKPDRGLLCAEV